VGAEVRTANDLREELALAGVLGRSVVVVALDAEVAPGVLGEVIGQNTTMGPYVNVRLSPDAALAWLEALGPGGHEEEPGWASG